MRCMFYHGDKSVPRQRILVFMSLTKAIHHLRNIISCNDGYHRRPYATLLLLFFKDTNVSFEND